MLIELNKHTNGWLKLQDHTAIPPNLLAAKDLFLYMSALHFACATGEHKTLLMRDTLVWRVLSENRRDSLSTATVEQKRIRDKY